MNLPEIIVSVPESFTHYWDNNAGGKSYKRICYLKWVYKSKNLVVTGHGRLGQYKDGGLPYLPTFDKVKLSWEDGKLTKDEEAMVKNFVGTAYIQQGVGTGRQLILDLQKIPGFFLQEVQAVVKTNLKKMIEGKILEKGKVETKPSLPNVE